MWMELCAKGKQDVSIYALGDRSPDIHPDAWIAPGAVIIGNVRLKAGVSVWFGSVLRGDNEWIEIGEGSNVQENCTLHTDPGFPLKVEANVTVGHNVILHGCTIRTGALIGMGSTVMNGAVVGEHCLVGSGTLITEKKDFSTPKQMIMGAPAAVKRELSDSVEALLEASAKHYAKNARYFSEHLRQID